LPKNPSYRTGQDDLLFNQVFFFTFEELKLPIRGAMEDAVVVKLYEPSPTPCLYVDPAENMAGRVPLIPLFLALRKHDSRSTIPHVHSKRKDLGFPMGCADAAALGGRHGSNVYEVNPWLWQFGRGKPRLGGLTVEETSYRQLAKNVDRKKRAAETRQLTRRIEPDGKLKCVWYMFIPLAVITSIDLVCTLYILSTNQVYYLNDRYGLMYQ
jgi:hypothetical protein